MEGKSGGILIITLAVILATACSGERKGREIGKAIYGIEKQEGDILFGLNSDSFIVISDMIRSNQFLADILLDYKVSYPTIHKLAMKSEGVFDIRRMQKGKPYTVFCSTDSTGRAECLIYEPSETEYIVFDLRGDSVDVRREFRPVTLVERSYSGEITSSLYQALGNSPQGIALAYQLAAIYAWTIDFYRLQKGDRFRIVYEEALVEDRSIGIHKIQAAAFSSGDRELFAYYFEKDGRGDFYDADGQNLRKLFLKSPLKFSRLTSGYSGKRLHPVQKVWKSHLGTDYAAPAGTPILSTGDGRIVESGFRKNNGNYVKIRHNQSYHTQYLHMSRISPQARKGMFVKQGDVIGYVGSTGLATGPHVCYRFWKDGKQVNHLKEEFPPAEPVAEEAITEFREIIIPLRMKLEGDTVITSGIKSIGVDIGKDPHRFIAGMQ